MTRVVHFTNNNYDGAGRAVIRLHTGLLKLDVDSKVYVIYKQGDIEGVFPVYSGKSLRDVLSNGDLLKRLFSLEGIKELSSFSLYKVKRKLLEKRWRNKSLFNYSVELFNYNTLKQMARDADVVLMHSIQNMISPEMVKRLYEDLKVPIIFRPLDMEPLTGGCHFNFGCQKFTQGCGTCPELEQSAVNDVSNLTALNKRNQYKSADIYTVASNSFLENRLKLSTVFSQHPSSIIYYGIEPARFAELSKSDAREKLGFEARDKIVLFGCFNFSDKRKGAHLLKGALDKWVISEFSTRFPNDSIHLVTFGGLNDFTFEDLGIKWTHYKFLKTSEEMNTVYRASDVLVSPSTDDIGPTIVQEAFMNKMALVSFELGVAIDLIKAGVNGYIVPCFDVEKLGRAILDSMELDVNQSMQTNSELQELERRSQQEIEAQDFLELIKRVSKV